MYASPKRIVYLMPDGNIRIDSPVINTEGDEGVTDDMALARAIQLVPTDALKVQVFDRAEIPSDREERETWARSQGFVK